MSFSTLPGVEPHTVQTWIATGEAVLIDVREPDEHARERIAAARLAPLSSFGPQSVPAEPGKTFVFHCNSGKRTTQAAEQLLRAAGGEAYQLAGGIQAWKGVGLPVITDGKAPLPVMRQVQIATGALVLLGLALAVLVSPWFITLAAAVGAGLVVAGITGVCGMATLLQRMPWNRVRPAPSPGDTAPLAPAR